MGNENIFNDKHKYVYSKRNAGVTYVEIAKKLGLSPERVRQIYWWCRSKMDYK